MSNVIIQYSGDLGNSLAPRPPTLLLLLQFIRPSLRRTDSQTVSFLLLSALRQFISNQAIEILIVRLHTGIESNVWDKFSLSGLTNEFRGFPNPS